MIGVATVYIMITGHIGDTERVSFYQHGQDSFHRDHHYCIVSCELGSAGNGATIAPCLSFLQQPASYCTPYLLLQMPKNLVLEAPPEYK